jgi:hypothetical protein
MKSTTRLILATLTLLAFSWTSAQAATVVFGGSNPVWVDDQTSYTLTNPNADGVNFTLDIATTNGNLNATNTGDVFGLTGGDDNLRLDADFGNAPSSEPETVEFTLSTTGTALASLAMDSISFTLYRSGDSDAADFSDGTNTVNFAGGSGGVSLTYSNQLSGLTALTESNIASWSLGVTPTAGDGIRVEALQFSYSVVPEPSSVMLLLGGLGALAFLRRQIKQ